MGIFIRCGQITAQGDVQFKLRYLYAFFAQINLAPDYQRSAQTFFYYEFLTRSLNFVCPSILTLTL